ANPELQALPRVELVSEQGCAYFIRKQKHPAGLSTLEAVAEVLQQLQPESVIRAPLKQAFLCFQKGLFTSELRTGDREQQPFKGA
ncbi:MAG: DTW domain-containing protein, partial [Thiotrichales bacterium]|nr:DTW domain-containing protein [Thiotrichales bacterium]